MGAPVSIVLQRSERKRYEKKNLWNRVAGGATEPGDWDKGIRRRGARPGYQA
jgi:hypothetical protein